MSESDTEPERQAAEQRWWDDWWGHDWSWEALKEKNWIGGDGHVSGATTIQDYWRVAPEEVSDVSAEPTWSSPDTDIDLEARGELLRAPDGRLWHIAHIPLYWDQERRIPTPKADAADPIHDRLNALIARYLSAGRETKFRGLPDPLGYEGRAMLCGVVWPQPSIPPTFCGEDAETYDDEGEKAVGYFGSSMVLHANFCRSWIGVLDAWRCTFGPGAEFFHVFFGGRADFTATTFRGRADFNDTMFAEGVLFNHATLSSQTRFDGAVCCGRAEFHRTRFLGLAHFSGARFREGATFESAEFGGNAHFHGV